MMTPTQREAYRTYRAKGWSAGHAYRVATHVPTTPPIAWTNSTRTGLPCATWTVDGYTMAAHVAQDETYSARDDAIQYTDRPVNAHDSRVVRRHPSELSNRYEPRYAIAHNAPTPAEYARAMSRHAADCKARAIAREMIRSADNDAHVYLTVIASKAGVTLGTFTLHGITLTGDDAANYAYLTDTAHECATDALHNARETLAKLCTSA